jgi:hypothetical protein
MARSHTLYSEGEEGHRIQPEECTPRLQPNPLGIQRESGSRADLQSAHPVWQEHSFSNVKHRLILGADIAREHTEFGPQMPPNGRWDSVRVADYLVKDQALYRKIHWQLLGVEPLAAGEALLPNQEQDKI